LTFTSGEILIAKKTSVSLAVKLQVKQCDSFAIWLINWHQNTIVLHILLYQNGLDTNLSIFTRIT